MNMVEMNEFSHAMTIHEWDAAIPFQRQERR